MNPGISVQPVPQHQIPAAPTDLSKVSKIGDLTKCPCPIPPETWAIVPAGATLTGDTDIQKRHLHDNASLTGAVAHFNSETLVYAQWGASVATWSYDEAKKLLKDHGCINGCADVEPLYTVP
jgi:hypothetical protein